MGPAPIPYYGNKVGGRERKKYQVFFFFSVFSVGVDHKLFSERHFISNAASVGG